MNIAIVTDSTCDWSSAEYSENRVVMVPLKIQIDNETLLDQEEISVEEFYDRMEASAEVPMTSQPSPGDFIAVYESLAAQGFDEVISIHLSPALSGTFASAEMAAENVTIPVSVIDSKQATSSLGLLVEAVCRMRDAGNSTREIVEKISALAPRTHLFIGPDSTDNLVKGGRLSEEQAQGAAMLNIKLIFTLDGEGRLANFDKVKGTKGILKRYIEIIEQYTEEFGPLRIRFMHSRNRAEIDRLIEGLKQAGIAFEISGIDSCGATIATHAGLGILGIALMPANE